MALLDELSGFEFEEAMASMFRKRGYKNVRVQQMTADEGRDIIMEKSSGSGPSTTYIVECKHTASVGRPVVQKLDSATNRYQASGPKRGMIVTSGRFTGPAKEYAAKSGVELMDGRDIREAADQIGMDLYNGRIEIICDEMLDPYHSEGPAAPFRAQFNDISNIEPDDVPPPRITLTLMPVIIVDTHVQRTFETGAGIIHRVDEQESLAIDASRGRQSFIGGDVGSLLIQKANARRSIDHDKLEERFGTVNQRRFGKTETEYREWITDRQIQRYTREVTYTGDNNVTYEKTCEPSSRDISVRSFLPAFMPRSYGSVTLQSYDYAFDWVTIQDDTVVIDDEIHRCVHCLEETAEGGPGSSKLTVAWVLGTLRKSAFGASYTYCENCGAIACQQHTRRAAVSDDPICTGCSVTDQFAGSTKHFRTQEAKEEYEEAYAERPVYAKPMENIPGLIGVTLLLVFMLLLLL